mmetsp:Transcript_12285/g.38216  ORF Transcript_12285/g.38216 Transcript_12285/m.38216 type:complete len:233 (-) Transcript_12285:90-788(-)|eukprot:CAMPEP_0174828150 /NCGR_PEP_ID=MMETSP1114-20130205/1167_1 /TAXON_ID=312471 /ORGANISM="Neobodo designis, Strain CCAP 1951/1" /LENGTH=232 /DNA_ID=CAMNT_0016061861 /DNA_START=108 /DNA_END=806 /DNA_ORIENTATION=+
MPLASAKPAPKAVDTRNAAFPYGAPVKPVGAAATETKKATETKALSRQRLDPSKCANPFQTDARKCKTQFSQSYVAGSIPCRLQSTASKHHLQWDAYAQTGFSPDLLVVCCDGLCEDQHPFTLMAPMMLEELVARSEGSAALFAPVIDQIAGHLRKALMSESSFARGLRALQVILGATDDLLLPYLVKIVPCLTKGVRDKNHRDDVLATLGLMEQQCGPEARKIIKSKIPTY